MIELKIREDLEKWFINDKLVYGNLFLCINENGVFRIDPTKIVIEAEWNSVKKDKIIYGKSPLQNSTILKEIQKFKKLEELNNDNKGVRGILQA